MDDAAVRLELLKEAMENIYVYPVPWGGYGASAVGTISDGFETEREAHIWAVQKVRDSLDEMVRMEHG
jgi:hypothetical protein